MLTDSALSVEVWVTTAPGSYLDHHWSLWVLPSLCSLRGQCSHGSPIDLPSDLVGSPINGVGMEVGLIVGIRMETSAVVSRGLTFSEKVALNLVGVASKPFPINFIQVIRLHYGAADNADTWRRFKGVLNVTEHDIPFRGQQWRVAWLGYCKASTVRIICRLALRCKRVRGSLCKVYVDGTTEGCVCFAAACKSFN
jgi:hypothetical protein